MAYMAHFYYIIIFSKTYTEKQGKFKIALQKGAQYMGFGEKYTNTDLVGRDIFLPHAHTSAAPLRGPNKKLCINDLKNPQYTGAAHQD